MSIFKTCFARIVHFGTWFATKFISFREPKVVSGEGKLLSIPTLLKENDKQNVLVVTDEGLWKLGIVNPLLEELKKANVKYEVYHSVVANPTVNNVNEGAALFAKQKCDSIVAIGGGSAMDAAKIIGVKSRSPKREVNSFKGMFKVHKKMPFMIAVPTTAGTGSEVTLAAVIVDKEKGDKYAVEDPKIIPAVAVLDPTLLVSLPKHITTTTGMDALTHAIEAYIGHENTRKTKRYAIDAIKLIFEYLEKSANEPTNLEYRVQMQIAAYKAGVAFTRAFVGTVHAIAHALGGKYNVPHGLANAIILPIILKEYGKSAHKKLAKIADLVNIGKGKNKHEKANLFIEEISKLNERLGITNTFGNLIKDEDIPFLVNHAYKEGAIIYPTPRILSKKELEKIIVGLKR